MYCECFVAKKHCTSECNCCDCHNKTDNSELINAIENSSCKEYISRLTSKDPNTLIGCKCKRSSCQRNYCFCYRRGVKCGPLCICLDCGNNNCEVKTSNNQKEETTDYVTLSTIEKKDEGIMIIEEC